MLVQFTVRNFRSFGEEATLNMVAVKRLTSHPNHCVPLPAGAGGPTRKVLRTAVMYGANAAGKSNLIKAMRFAQFAIKSGDQNFASPQKFRFDPAYSSQPSTFEFRFLVFDLVFIYGFDASADSIESEWLRVVQGDDEVLIFSRDKDGATTLNNDLGSLFPIDKRAIDTLSLLSKVQLTSKQLFLNRIKSVPAPVQGTVISGIINWLTNDLVILSVESRSRDIVDRLQRDRRFRNFSQRFLHNVGTGVSELFVVERERPVNDFERQVLSSVSEPSSLGFLPWDSTDESDSRIDQKDPSKVITRTIVSAHGPPSPYRVPLSFSEESDGTKQLLHLMPVIYPSQQPHSKVVVIDELDRSLHPLICWEFIRFFSESSGDEHRQLIVTTHEAHLLNQDLLRRDEYWFVEKDATQQSRLVSLSDFNIRKDLQVEKGYLNGRFGAVPIIGNLAELEKLLECGEESGSAL